MKDNTCFVVMPIGSQNIGETVLSEKYLKEKYDYIIKAAIMSANPTLNVIRSDEELNPASMSNDIFLKLMHSKYVIADITYPNPNVFYELGIRHAIRNGTILIREKIDTPAPFDISHLRYIEYTQDPAGMSKLAEELRKRFEFYANFPSKPDNQFLELCSFTKYSPDVYKSDQPKSIEDTMSEFFELIFSSPDMLQSLSRKDISEEERNELLIKAFSKNPKLMANLVVSSLNNL